MAVFTPVSFEAAAGFVADYEAGALGDIQPITEGVENTNYKIRLGERDFVLTLFEKRTRAEDVARQLALLAHWADDGLPAPQPLRRSDGAFLGTLCTRPAAVLEWRPGAWPRTPSLEQTRQAALALARMHESARAFRNPPPHRFGPPTWRRWLEECRTGADSENAAHLALIADLTAELDDLDALWPENLPSTTIHGDFFPDNVLYTGDEVTGLIDPYFAGEDFRAYDLAVAINAWGFDAEGAFKPDITTAFARSYDAAAVLSPEERSALPVLCRGAAARFTLSRLHDLVHINPDWIFTPKDPEAFHRRLDLHRNARDCSVYGL